MMAVWDEACLPFLATEYPWSTVTTPALPSLSVVVDPDACREGASACQYRDERLTSCSRLLSTEVIETTTVDGEIVTFTHSTTVSNYMSVASSCLCDPVHLYQASVCFVEATSCNPEATTRQWSTVLECRLCGSDWVSCVPEPCCASHSLGTNQPGRHTG